MEPPKKGIEMPRTIEELDKLIETSDDAAQVELLTRMKNKIVQRDAAVEKINAFRAEFEKSCGLFYEALEAVSTADDYSSEVDARIAKSIDEHLRAADMLCRFGNEHGFGIADDGFGEKHLFPDNDDY